MYSEGQLGDRTEFQLKLTSDFMSGIGQYLNEPRRPEEGKNNIWYHRRDTDRVIVFVHGVLSHSAGCWYCSGHDGQPGVYWPDLLANDPEFRQYSIYLGGYFSEFTSREFGVSDAADQLFRALDRHDKGQKSVFDHTTILFVCHSTGGVVVRYLLESNVQTFVDKTVGLVLIASPSYGSRWASSMTLRIVGRIYQHSVARELQWASPILRDLDDRFRTLLEDERIPRLAGAEACENHFVFRRRYLPPLPQVVKKESAGRYFGRTTMLPDTDHFTSVKPASRDHPVYTFLSDFCVRFERKFLKQSETYGVANVRHSPVGRYVCRAIQWDVDIDMEGGASNEMSFSGLVLLDSQKENWIELPETEVLSGQSQPWDLVRDERTSPGVTAELSAKGARFLRPRLKFANRPSEERPVSFCLRNYDLNVFSMNIEEFQARPDFRADGTDYVEKFIEEDLEFLMLTVHIPTDMKLAHVPYFEVYEYKGSDARLHEGLTSALQPFFRYAPLLRTSMLQIQHPAAPYAYRISWQLGDPDGIQTDDNAIVRKRKWEFATRMRKARDSFLNRSSEPSAARMLGTVLTALTSFTEYVQELIKERLGESAKLDAKLLSVSLMVLSADSKQLIIVAGSVADPSFTLDVGDGNAGAAWKRRVARIYDKGVAASKDNVLSEHTWTSARDLILYRS